MISYLEQCDSQNHRGNVLTTSREGSYLNHANGHERKKMAYDAIWQRQSHYLDRIGSSIQNQRITSSKMEYLSHLLALICIYAIVVTSLDFVVGHAGLFSIGQASLYGIGAYTSALLAIHYDIPVLAALLGSITITTLTSMLIAFLARRLQGGEFVLGTMCFQIVTFTIINNWTALTRGSLGLPKIPHGEIFGWAISPNNYWVVTLFFLITTLIVMRRLTTSPFGRVLHAMREGDSFPASLGKNPFYFKATAIAISAAMTGCAGGLYAQYVSYIEPNSFSLTESVLFLSMVIIGGAGSRWGSTVGAFLLVVIPELLRFIGISTAAAGNLRQIMYGLCLVTVIIFRPRGLFHGFEFTK